MANFEPIVQWLLYQEDDHRIPGKIVDLGDGAGLTRLGITSKNFGTVMPAGFFADMPFRLAVQAAKTFYQMQEWHHINGDNILNDELAACIFSFAVNKSVPTAVQKLQLILGVQSDGVLGLQTLQKANTYNGNIVATYRASWAGYYQGLAAINPNDRRFLDGWLNRVNFPYPSPLVGNLYD